MMLRQVMFLEPISTPSRAHLSGTAFSQYAVVKASATQLVARADLLIVHPLSLRLWVSRPSLVKNVFQTSVNVRYQNRPGINCLAGSKAQFHDWRHGIKNTTYLYVNIVFSKGLRTRCLFITHLLLSSINQRD